MTMRVLTALNIGYPVVGGAQMTHQTYLRRLARERGHECFYLDAAHASVPLARGPVHMDYFRDAAELRAKMERARPQVVMAGFTLIHEASKLGHALGIPVIGWMNSYEYCPPTPEETRAWHLTHAHRYPSPEERAFALQNADRLVVNSQFLAARLERLQHVRAQVIYPAFDARALWVSPRAYAPQFILGVCGYPHKGADIFLEMARRFTREHFLLAGAIHADYFSKFRALENVTLVPFTPIRDLLKQTKLLLAPSQWDEPFGRIAIEAMANKIPALVSHAAGLAEIVGENGHGVRAYHDADAWEAAVQDLLAHPTRRRENAECGREIAARFLSDAPIQQLDALLRELHARPPTRPVVSKTIAWVGDTNPLTAFALANAQLRAGLTPRGFDVRLVTTTAQFLPVRADVTIHHDYAQEFRAVTPPPHGHWIAIRTWDFGKYPPAWVEKIRAECDQLWVYSRWVRQQALASGLDAARVRVMPLGIDPKIFHPDGGAFTLPTAKTWRFLFVGGPILRKGLDILLQAYRAAFTRADDVCLVVKDNPRDVFYRGARLPELETFAADADAPEIVYVDAALSAHEMAALYRACNVGVFPYRAEGFALPILEAMACGTPSIVPQFGACLDYCTARTSFFVQPLRIHLPVHQELAYNTLGFRETVAEVDFCQIPAEQLARALREVHALGQHQRALVEQRARAGVRIAHERFTWQHTLQHVERALEALPRTPHRFLRARREQAKQRRVFEAARALYLGLPENASLPARQI
jgi:glycosyltransferase involved in cell wall biosynthesis